MTMRKTLLLLVVILFCIPFEAPAAEKPVILFGVIPRYNPIIMYRSYQPMMDYLTENTPYRFELKLSRDYEQAVEFLKNGTTPVASLGDVTFAEAQQRFGAVPILKPLNPDGKPYYRSILIVRENSSIETLEDLKGKSFAFGDPHSTSGNLIPRDYLFKNGISLFDLGSFVNLESHDAVAKAVLKGNVDCGAVKDVVAYRYREHGLRFLAMSYPIPAVPIVVREDAPAALISSLSTALQTIDRTDPAMAETLETWDPEFSNGFVPASLEDYQAIFNLMNDIPEGCGTGCH